MKLATLILFFLISVISLSAQDKVDVLKEGKLYFIATEEVLLPTKTIHKTLKQFDGKVKMILESDELQYQKYQIPEFLLAVLDEFKPIDSDYVHDNICDCKTMNTRIIIQDRFNECDECCYRLTEVFRAEYLR